MRTPVRGWNLSRWDGMSGEFWKGIPTILKHDAGVRTHRRIVADTPQIVTYQFQGF
jgi:hypothetical protein